jgi:hypothetical protein
MPKDNMTTAVENNAGESIDKKIFDRSICFILLQGQYEHQQLLVLPQQPLKMKASLL